MSVRHSSLRVCVCGGGGGGGGCWLSKACEFLVACQIYIDVMCKGLLIAEVGFDGREHAEVGFDGLELGMSMQRWGSMALNWV